MQKKVYKWLDKGLITKDEALNMFAGFKGKSIYVLMNNNTVLKAYCAYMKYYHGLNVDVAYESINIDDLRPCVDKGANKLLSRDEMTEIEDQLLNDSDKAIVELLFEGVAGKNMEEIYAVSEECVKGDVLEVNGKIFPMTNRLEELLPKAFCEIEIMSYGESMRIVPVVGKGQIYKERSNARGANSDDAKFRYFYRKIQIFRDYLDMPGLTMKNISASGLWHYLQTGMQETGLDLRGFLRTAQGKELSMRYGFSGDYYLENVYAKYEQYTR